MAEERSATENGNLLARPYLRGTTLGRKNVNNLFQTIFFTIYVLLPIVHVGLVYIGYGDQIYAPFGLVYLLLFLFALWTESFGRARTALTIIDLMLFLVSISGAFGAGALGGTQNAVVSIAYTLFLLLRNFVLFTMVPRFTSISLKDLSKYAQIWAYRGSLVFALLTIAFALSKGYGFNGARFAETNWLHPNWSAMYGGLLILLSVVGKQIKLYARWIGVGVGLAFCLMMQSRAVFAALGVSFVTMYLFNLDAGKVKTIVASIFLGIVGWFTIPLIAPSLSEFTPIQNMVKRTQTVDPTAGRIEFVQSALEAWQRSPVFGLGYKTSSKIDNFMLTYIQETGLVGIVLYYVFLGTILFYSIKAYKKSTDPDVRNIARTAIILNMFVFTRSFAEATSIFHLSDIVSNCAFFWSGMVFAGLHTVPKGKEHGMEHLSFHNGASSLQNKPKALPSNSTPKPAE